MAEPIIIKDTDGLKWPSPSSVETPKDKHLAAMAGLVDKEVENNRANLDAEIFSKGLKIRQIDNEHYDIINDKGEKVDAPAATAAHNKFQAAAGKVLVEYEKKNKVDARGETLTVKPGEGEHKEGEGGFFGFMKGLGASIPLALIGMVIGTALTGGNIIMGLLIGLAVLAVSFFAGKMMGGGKDDKSPGATPGKGNKKDADGKGKGKEQDGQSVPGELVEATYLRDDTMKPAIDAKLGTIIVEKDGTQKTYFVSMPGELTGYKSAKFQQMEVFDENKRFVGSVDLEIKNHHVTYKTAKDSQSILVTNHDELMKRAEKVAVNYEQTGKIVGKQERPAHEATTETETVAAEKRHPGGFRIVDATSAKEIKGSGFRKRYPDKPAEEEKAKPAYAPHMDYASLHTLKNTSNEVFASIGTHTMRAEDGQQREYTAFLRGTKNNDVATFDRVVFENRQGLKPQGGHTTVKLPEPMSLPIEQMLGTEVIHGSKKLFDNTRNGAAERLKSAAKGSPLVMDEPSKDAAQLATLATEFKAGKHDHIPVGGTTANIPNKTPDPNRTV